MSNQISELLPQLMVAVGAIGKDRRNQHQNYQFRGIDDVLNHVGPPCAELGIRVSPTIHDYQSNVVEWEDGGKHKFQVRVTLRMRLEFTAPDGSVHVAEAVGEAIDTNGDKASNKAMSAAFKYACFMGIVIPVSGALDDSDTDDKQPTRPAPKPPKKEPQQRKAATTPQVAKPSGGEATEEQKGRFIAMLDPVRDAAIELFRKWKWIGPDQELAFVPLSKVPKTKKEFEGIMADIQAFMDGGTGPAESETSENESWRAYPIPFGKDKGTKLGELNKKSLFGWWANYDPNTDKDGKPKAKVYSSDVEFREILDAAGAHYKFSKDY